MVSVGRARNNGRGRARRGGRRYLRPLGHGFVEFATRDSALTAIEKMNGTTLFGRLVKVELAHEKPPSSTTLYVGNLPFSVDDEKLYDLFKDTNPVKAHVVRTRNNLSCGYGFVEYANRDDQQAAIEVMNGLEIEVAR